MREVPVEEVLRLAMREHGYHTVNEVRYALADPPYNVTVGRSYLADIINGARPWPKDDTLFGALLHLLGLELADLAIPPEERPGVWMMLEYAKEHGWRGRRLGGPDDGAAIDSADDEVNSINPPQRSFPDRRELVGSGVGAHGAAGRIRTAA